MEKIIITILLSSFLSGCASTGKKFSSLEKAQSDKSLIYVMRAWRLYRGAATLDVYINDEKIGNLPNGSFLPVEVEPSDGIVTISASMSAKIIGWHHAPMSIEYQIKENETKFFMLDSITNYFIPVSSFYVAGVDIDLFELGKEEALKVLPKLSLAK
ncbi:Uncharacterised protein [Zhongshania aliphaticivorans]|uniref:DUF2846 domain-containing protein n=1 Tax=Zhongshania aliphaticivorans TaxID=1470434 RepID=A0A5S9Q8Q1_9GAMM|nr:DUF2846 domain-containing protein [Zhongshania aliphaticivorans]CAA0103545.1 Uncharacterised protein [Zhongshania aliphaticivorans]CAA0113432.1 Uncharacterised protein [Zhongshania aliphaticivorans]